MSGAYVCLLVLVGCWAGQTQARSYQGYKVIAVTPSSQNDINLLREIQGHYTDTVVFWEEPVIVGRNITVALDPVVYIEVVPQLQNAGMPMQLKFNNLQELIDSEMPDPGHKSAGFDILQYNTIDDINNHLDSLARGCRYCSVIEIGTSYEGRPLKVLKLSDGRPKHAIWIDAGIHAREWIAPASALYIIDRLTDRGNGRQIRNMIKYHDVYILPVVNPDGYAYTWTDDRLWRKTRSPNPGSPCTGTDPNRNWDFHWNEQGASSEPCADTYAGSMPFSEPETTAVAEFLLSEDIEFDIYLTLHSYGQYWLTPWGYTSALPEDYGELVYVANKATNTIEGMYGNEYTVGSSTNVLYVASGGSDDWAKGVAGIKFAYTVELQDQGQYGFLLPPDRIQGQGRELWAAVRVMTREVTKMIYTAKREI